MVDKSKFVPNFKAETRRIEEIGIAQLDLLDSIYSELIIHRQLLEHILSTLSTGKEKKVLRAKGKSK